MPDQKWAPSLLAVVPTQVLVLPSRHSEPPEAGVGRADDGVGGPRKWVSVRQWPLVGPASTPEQTEPPPAFEALAGPPHPTPVSGVPCHPHQPGGQPVLPSCISGCQCQTPVSVPSGLSYEW